MSKTPHATVARTIADWKKNHDPDTVISTKIKAALAKLRAIGSQHFEYEKEFCTMAGVSHSVIGKYREEFASHIVMTPRLNGERPRLAWFGNASTATSVRGGKA
jgi:uncharacterized protein YmfQ (DUF2313 family)